MDCGTPGFPVLHHLLELAQTHVHWVSDAIQASRPLFVVPFSSCLLSFPASGSFPALHIRWPKYYWSFSFSISPCNEYSGLISLGLTGLISLQSNRLSKSLLQHHGSKASILWCSAFFVVQLLHPYMTTGETIALNLWTFVGKVMSLFFNMLFRFVIAFLPRNESFNFMTCRCIAPISASVTAWPWILCLCLHVAVSSPYNERTLVLLD